MLAILKAHCLRLRASENRRSSTNTCQDGSNVFPNSHAGDEGLVENEAEHGFSLTHHGNILTQELVPEIWTCLKEMRLLDGHAGLVWSRLLHCAVVQEHATIEEHVGFVSVMTEQ